MARYQLSPDDIPYAREFLAKPFGYASPGLQRVLNRMRGLGPEGKYVLLCLIPHALWQLARLPARRGLPIIPVDGVAYTDLETAERDVFLRRWDDLGGPPLPADVRVLAPAPAAVADLPPMRRLTLIGYTDRLSAAPGERLGVKVGAYGARSYRAELRRIIQGDRSPAGPGYRDVLVAADLCGTRAALSRPIRAGSCATIADPARVLTRLDAFTLAAPVMPTMGGSEAVVAALDGAGVELGLDPNGRPTMRLGPARVTLSRPLPLNAWTVLMLSADPATGVVRLEARDVDGTCLDAAEAPAGNWSAHAATGMTIAARAPGEAHFNGKIDSPLLLDRACDGAEVVARLAQPHRLPRAADMVAYWDFSRLIATPEVEDAGPNHLHGQLHQTPARAMTGWRWDGRVRDWTQDPAQYSAIHFHADDMTDAAWPDDFAVDLPDDLPSGIYAVRLIPDGDEDAAYHCVFAVRPRPGQPSASRACLLLPTASYLAYGNHRLGLDVAGTEIGMGRLVEIDAHHAFLQEHPELGFSFYEVHADGSGVFHSSRRRPLVDMQPGVKGFLGGLGSNVWQLSADTHITGFLDHEGVPCDVITDEDLHTEGLARLAGYAVLITGTHPEYHSTAMLDAIEAFTRKGGRLMYLGGNGFYWRISYSDARPGVIECRRSEAGIRPWEPGIGQFHHAFDGAYGGLWRRNDRPSAALAGLVMSSQGFDLSEPYVLTDAAADPRVDFLFAGIDRRPGRAFGAFGLSGGGAAGMEIDRADPALGTPAHALVLGSSQRHTDIYLMAPEDLLDPTPDMTGTQAPAIRADLCFFETGRGGAVFATGSIAWAAAMAWNGYDNEVARMTANALRRFLDPRPLIEPTG